MFKLLKYILIFNGVIYFNNVGAVSQMKKEESTIGYNTIIRHVVFFKSPDKKIIPELKTRLDTLPGHISYILNFETGIDVLHTERSFDLVLIADFKSLEDLEKYANDSYHKQVISWIKEHNIEVKAVDFQK